MTESSTAFISTLVNRFITVRQRTEALIQPLEVEDFTPQSALFASPPKWHIAHTTWFFEEMILKKFKPDYKVFDESFGFLFNSYYNSIGERVERNARGLITRPPVSEVLKYRKYVDEQLTLFIHHKSDTAILTLLELGINHEEQHQELLLTDLKYTFSLNPLSPVYDPNTNFTSKQNKSTGWLEMEEGVYAIGAKGEGFTFDNEHGLHKVFLHAFSIAKDLVTNAEYIAFIDAGGYEQHDLWLDEGWAWVNEQKTKTPLYWKKIDQVWYHYTLGGLKKVDPTAILTHVNFYEACAFAHWKGMRLPTEFEWEVAAPQLDWGNNWEWTSSAYLPYPFFKVASGAVGEYNGKFMVNQMVLRGASPVTASGHSRLTYRNFFHPHYQWQFSGIRLAKHNQ